MAQPRSRGERKHRQPAMDASLPKSRGHTFAEQALGGLAGVRVDTVSQECRRQPERIGDPLDGIKARSTLASFKVEHYRGPGQPRILSNGDKRNLTFSPGATKASRESQVLGILSSANHALR